MFRHVVTWVLVVAFAAATASSTPKLEIVWDTYAGDFEKAVALHIAPLGDAAVAVVAGYPSTTNGSSFTAHRAVDGVALWGVTVASNLGGDNEPLYDSNPAGIVAYATDANHITVVNAAGVLQWTASSPLAVQAIFVESDNRDPHDVVVAVLTQSAVLLFRRGQVQATIAVAAQPGYAPPTIVMGHGVVLIPSPTSVAAYDVESGVLLWENSAAAGATFTRGSFDGRATAAYYDAAGATVLDIRSGNVVMNFTVPEGAQLVPSDVTISGRLVVLTSLNMAFRAASRTTGGNNYPSVITAVVSNGTVAWQFETEQTVTSVRIVDAVDQVAFATADAFKVVSASDGAVLGSIGRVQNYNYGDRPAFVRGLYCFTGGLNYSHALQLVATKVMQT